MHRILRKCNYPHVYFACSLPHYEERACEADTAPDRLQGMFLFMCQVSFCIALSFFASRRAKSSGFSCSLNFHPLLYISATAICEMEEIDFVFWISVPTCIGNYYRHAYYNQYNWGLRIIIYSCEL